jgi:hypothetical protein
MACAPLPVEIASHNLTPCVIVALYCKNCEEVRLALDSAPAVKYLSCPICDTTCDYVVLGVGGTMRSLPVWSRPQSAFRFEETNFRHLRSNW